MENHLSFDPYQILSLPYIWNIKYSDLNKAYISMQEKYHPDILKTEDDSMSILISQSYSALKDHIRRGRFLIYHFQYTSEITFDMDIIFDLQEAEDSSIKNRWLYLFHNIDKAFNNGDRNVCNLFEEFIYVENLRSRRKIVIIL